MGIVNKEAKMSGLINVNQLSNSLLRHLGVKRPSSGSSKTVAWKDIVPLQTMWRCPNKCMAACGPKVPKKCYLCDTKLIREPKSR